MLTIEMLETVFGKLLEQAQERELSEEEPKASAEMIVRIVEVFPEWQGKVVGMRKKLEKVKGKPRGSEGWAGKGFYGVYRPIEGVAFCLVPS